MTLNLDSLLTKFFAAFSLPIRHYRKDEIIKTYEQRKFVIDIAKIYMDPYIGKEYPICFVVSPEYILSGYIALKNDEYLIFGPSSPHELTYNQGEKILHELGLPASFLEELLRYFRFMPQMSTSNFQNMLSFINEILRPEQKGEPVHLTYRVKHINLCIQKELYINEKINAETEKSLLPLIAVGMVDEAAKIVDSIFTSAKYDLPNLAPTNIRSLKNSLIITAATISRKALEGGLDYRTAMSLSDYYIVKIEDTTIISELYELFRTMVLDFTQRVSVLSRPNTSSPIVNAIYRNVQEHKYEKITSATIAKQLSFSSSYISHHFKDITGMTLTEYIHTQKIKEAQYLLDTTDLSLAAIAEKMGFSSQQQFQLIFKQVTGITPKEYQKQHFK